MSNPGSADTTPDRASSAPARQIPFGASGEPTVEFSPLRFGNFLLRHRRLVIALPLALALIVAVATLLAPRTYTSEARFMPQGGSSTFGSLAGLASQFGFSLPTFEDPGHSIEFYAELVTGRSILRQAVMTEYAVDVGDEEATLVDVFEVDGDTPEEQIENAMEELSDVLAVSGDAETGTVLYSVETHSPRLSVQITRRILELVNDFNVNIRRTQAAAEAEFAASELQRAENELRTAENALKRFVEQNRRYDNSPELTLEHDRLERRVDMRQQVFTTLSGLYEQAKIDEVRNTPVITVVEPPDLPAEPDPRRLILKSVISLILGMAAALLIAVVRELGARSREKEPEEWSRFRSLRRQTVEDLRGLGRRIRRQAGGVPPGRP